MVATKEMSKILDEEAVVLEPTSEWTEHDRLMVVCAITAQMRGDSRSLVPQDEVATWAQKITFVLVKPAEFLEDNRKQILDGLSFPAKH